MFVLMKDGPSEGLNNLFELECVGAYETRQDALEALKANYEKAVDGLREDGYEFGLESQSWLDEDRLEALVADDWGCGVALRVFEVFEKGTSVADMYLRTFRMPEEDEVNAMVDDLVDTVANTITKAAMLVAVNGRVDGNWLWRMVMDECERVTAPRGNASYVVMHYGLSDALVGGADFEDAPIRRFEDDVFDAVETELTNREVEITC